MRKATEFLEINQEVCLKCGGCVAMYSDIFEFDNAGIVTIKQTAEIQESKIPIIQDICPVEAIVKKEK